jgi:hypothetical protein
MDATEEKVYILPFDTEATIETFKGISFLKIASLGVSKNDKRMVWALMLEQADSTESFRRVGIAEFAPEAGGVFDPDPWDIWDISII